MNNDYFRRRECIDSPGIFISVEIIIIFINMPRWAHIYMLQV